MNLLLALAIPAMASSTGTFKTARIDALEVSLNSFLVGRSTITGRPNLLNGVKCVNSSGNCLTFSDGSTQNTAFTGGGSTISVAASLYGNGQSAANPVGVDSSSVPIFQAGKYPAANGSLITSLTESQISNLTTDLAAKASSGTNSDVIGFTLPLTSVSSVTIQAQGFSVGTASFTVAGGSATVAYKLTAGSIQASSASLTATGVGVYDLTLSSSIQFVNTNVGIKWQDGTISTSAGGVTGPAGPAGAASSMTITMVRDNFLAQVNGVTTVFTLTNTPANTAAIDVVLDGLLQSSASDYTYSAPTTITMTTAPAANSSSFFVTYAVNTTTIPFAPSSSTIIPITGTNQATCIVCIASVTLTTTGSKVAVYVSGILNQSSGSSANVHSWLCVQQDGQFVAPYTKALGIYGWADGGQNYHDVGFRTVFQTAPSAASHTYCLGIVNDSGRTFPFDQSFSQGIFGAEEVK